MILEHIKTLDGSSTLYRTDLHEHYHSLHGAIQESMHVFINSGLKVISKPIIRIFEVGFGTGLNVMLSLIEAEKDDKTLIYDSIEKYPIPMEIINLLNYPSFFPLKYQDYFYNIHLEKWNIPLPINNASFTKISGDIKTFQIKGIYDLVYFDAFSPDKEPELWSPDIFRKIYNAIDTGGCLITYSVKGVIRRRLEDIGFLVERLTGPPGKKQIMRAIKNDRLSL